MAAYEHEILMEKKGQVLRRKRIKQLGVILSNTYSKQFQDNYEPIWNNIKKDLLRWDKNAIIFVGQDLYDQEEYFTKDVIYISDTAYIDNQGSI